MSRINKNIISKEELEDLFVNQNLTRNQIAEKLGIKPDSVKYLIKINGITKPDSLRVKNIAKTKLERYGDPYFYDKEKAKQTMFKKYGVEHALQSVMFVNKARETTLERYGDENYRNIEKIKQTKLDNFGDENYNNREKARETTLERYGVEAYSQTDECKNKVKQTKLERYGDENYRNIDKMKQTCLEKYGVENPQVLDNIKEKIAQTKLERYGDSGYHNIDKMKQTCLERYGVPVYTNPLKMMETKLEKYNNSGYNNVDKIKKTCLEKYGVDNYSKTEEYQKKVYDKMIENKSLSVSKDEDVVYNLLCKHFSEVVRQYKSDLYPYPCDFYIPEIDTYIEYQGTWQHGGEAFIGTEEQIKKVKLWENKSNELNVFGMKKNQYKNAIKVWTLKDVEKRKTAENNKLSWLEFFSVEEVKEWLGENNVSSEVL